jgi:prepilin peptidase CpaA
MIAAVPLILFPFCLIAAALHDARRFKIPNGLSAALIAGFGIAAVIIGMPLADLINHGTTAAVVLAVGFGLFYINERFGIFILGAGDTKMLTAIALWFGWPAFLTTLVIISLVGGALCLGICYARGFTRKFPALSAKYEPMARLAATQQLRCPYGIAISIGALLTFRNSPLFDALTAQLL